MPDTKVVKPYEILLRFGCEVGETAGHLRGVSLQQKAFLVDEKGAITARLERGGDDHPKDFPVDQLKNLLGDTFVAFERQLTAEREAAKATHDKLRKDHADAHENLVNERTRHAALRQRLSDVIAQAHADSTEAAKS